MKRLNIYLVILFFASSVYCSAQVTEQKVVELKAVNIKGYTQEQIVKIIETVSAKYNKSKIGDGIFNFKIIEKLTIDDLFLLDTSYTDRLVNLKKIKDINAYDGFLSKYFDFELSRMFFFNFQNSFNYVFSENLFLKKKSLFKYSLEDLDTTFKVLFESNSVMGSLLIDKQKMLPLSLTQALKNKVTSGRLFTNYDNKYNLDIEYVIERYILKVDYKIDENDHILIKAVDKDLALVNYKIKRMDKKSKKLILNDFYKSIVSKINLSI
ncbi:hypothetical protein ACHMWN_04165 [Pedobacter sp. UC225_61]|uniref:hypothetical protein n=1 Tax=Pedobacter sp. UC225_61 TaxID=3374623 RepID=UPI0037B71900